jgi:hypothetical protein
MIEQIMSHGLSEQAAKEIIEILNPLNEMEIVRRRSIRQKRIEDPVPMVRGDKVPCEIYSRVVGYMRPVSQWNLGKQEEFSHRLPFKIPEVI